MKARAALEQQEYFDLFDLADRSCLISVRRCSTALMRLLDSVPVMLLHNSMFKD